MDLALTLQSGQAFRWLRDSQGIWWGAIGADLVTLWQGAPSADLFFNSSRGRRGWPAIRDYLRLDVDLSALYADWMGMGGEVAAAAQTYAGLRILRQDPVECFFAFQCASCNTMVKIGRSVRFLAQRYGGPLPSICALEPPAEVSDALFAFPDIRAIAAADEMELRSARWGYRAPRVLDLARALLNLQAGWLEELRRSSYLDARAALVALPGIGPKVADCICLFSLDKDESVPIDTHVRRAAVALLRPDLATRSLTRRVYDELADAMRSRFGPFAGWAQQYLFMQEADSRRKRRRRSPGE